MKKQYARFLALLCAAWLAATGVAPAQSFVPYHIAAKVFLDTIGNCVYDPGEAPVPGVQLRCRFLPSNGIESIWWSGDTVDVPVTFAVADPADTLVRVFATTLQNLGAGCPMVYEIPLASLANDTIHVSFAVRSGPCVRMGVDISGPPPRPCFDRSYGVRCCNYGMDTAQNVFVLVTLDSNLLFQSSTHPAIALPNHTWRFDLGTVEPFGCRNFNIDYQLDCETPLGQTICSEALVYPDTFCLPNSVWNGAAVLAQGVCEADSVHFSLTNIGATGTSPDLGYVIAEDLIMYRQDVYSLGASESLDFGMPANGATWHLSADQEPGYPGGNYTNATIEGCVADGSGGTTGVFLVYPFSTGRANGSRVCDEAVGSFDPNELTGRPVGYGPEHLIRAGDDLDYLVHFQNTGTDTAYKVVIRETLPAGLDPTSVVPGAASHGYVFSMNQNGVMAFTFNNINLPDSASDQAGSNGFVNYRARPLPGLPNGSVIAGAADIYFDFNPPITTNSVFHTVGEGFISVLLDAPQPEARVRLSVSPNPATRYVQLVWAESKVAWQADLFDVTGRLLATVTASGDVAELDCRSLPPGLYIFRVRNAGGSAVAATGKILVH